METDRELADWIISLSSSTTADALAETLRARLSDVRPDS
jgi:hypothetical protein